MNRGGLINLIEFKPEKTTAKLRMGKQD